MITTIKDKEVNITWKETGAVQTVIVKSIDLMNNLICLQDLETNKLLFWVGMDDIDVIQINDPNYNPDLPDSVFGPNGEIQPNITPGIIQNPMANGNSFVKVSMEFLLPHASPEFYMASNAPNAFSAIYKIMEMLGSRQSEVEKAGKHSTLKVISEIKQEAEKILEEFRIDFDDEMLEKKPGQPN